MARLFFFSLLLVSFVSLNNANVIPEQLAIQAGDAPVRTTDSWAWATCGTLDDPVQITSIVVSPDPPQPGKNLTVTVNADVLERIEDGATVDVTVKIGLVKLLQKTFDLCEEADNANASVTCPVEVGTYEVVQTVALPKEIPKAKFSVNVKGYTAEEDDMVCLNLVVDFMKRPFFKFGF